MILDPAAVRVAYDNAKLAIDTLSQQIAGTSPSQGIVDAVTQLVGQGAALLASADDGTAVPPYDGIVGQIQQLHQQAYEIGQQLAAETGSPNLIRPPGTSGVLGTLLFWGAVAAGGYLLLRHFWPAKADQLQAVVQRVLPGRKQPKRRRR